MSTHLDDLTLLRLLDGCDIEDPPGAHDHLAGCARCRSRYDTTRHTSATISRLIAAADPAVPPLSLPARSTTRRSRPLLAAGVVLLLSAGALVHPVRGWIANAVTRILNLEPAAERVDAPTADPGADASGTAAVELVVPGRQVHIRVAARQGEGAIRIRTRPGGPVRATVTDGTAREGFVVTSAGLLIENASDSKASYLIEVPLRIERITIRLAGEPLAPILTAGPDTTWTIPLVPDQ